MNELDKQIRTVVEDMVHCRKNGENEKADLLKRDLEILKKKKKELIRKETILYWKTRRPFKNEDDIPDIPVMDKEDYETHIIPNIIRCGGIPKKELIEGATYIGNCRNAIEAVWNGKRFTYRRYKFGYIYDEDINHFEDDNGYDLFVPIKLKETKQ